MHKKDETTKKENYGPVSVLPLISEIFERIIYDRLSEYLEKYLNSILYRFRKAYSAQHALFKLFQAWQEELDKGGFVGTMLMDLSKLMIVYHMTFLLQNYKLMVLIRLH